MEEQRATLKKAIAALPQYEAPTSIWSGIELQLEIDHKDQLIQKTIPQLEVYAAPDLVWEGIQDRLKQNSEPRRISMLNWRRFGSIAAGILVLFSIGYGLWPSQPSSASYTAYTETVDEYLLEADWDADEAAFAQVVKMHDDYSKTFHDKESIGLKEELQELNAARKELKSAIDLYGNDHELIRQLAALERDRTQIIKQMAFKI